MRRSNEGNASNLDGSPEKHSRQASSSSSSSGSVPIALASTSTDESDTKKNEDNASGASSTLSSQPDSVELSRAKNEDAQSLPPVPKLEATNTSSNPSLSEKLDPKAAVTAKTETETDTKAQACKSPTSDEPKPSTSNQSGENEVLVYDNPKLPELSYEIEDYTHPSKHSKHDLKQTYKWIPMLSEPDFIAAPVRTFKHVPLSGNDWDYMTIGMKVEVENFDITYPPGFEKPVYWIATVLRFNGYYALLRYEGFGQDGSKDFWMNICSDQIFSCGYCYSKGKSLVPPETIKNKYEDFFDYTWKRLTGAKSLPYGFCKSVMMFAGSFFQPGMKLEVVDKMRICQVRVATVQEITGRRLYLTYDNVDTDDNGFWCHEESPLIHPVGWAKKVGHQIVASQEYFSRCALEEFTEEDCTPDMFPENKQAPGTFSVGMKIEAVDPLNLASICVATVMKVLRFGYIMIRIDGYEADETNSDWFCYHATSPLIFPPGFCEKNHITLKPPAGWEDRFTWYDYLQETSSSAAPVALFLSRDEIKHPFRVGMKLEAADQMDPRLICVSTVSRVVGRLLKIHFDGWEDDYDQWMDCESVDIYPVGWAELVGHKLEGPRQAQPPKKPKAKQAGKKGKKRTSAGSSSANGTAANASGPSSSGSSSGRKKKTSASPTGSNPSPASAPSPSPSPREATPTSKTPPPPVLEPQITPPPQKYIPRLIDSTGGLVTPRGKDANLNPTNWSVEDVSTFLNINDCSSLVDCFSDQGVDGNKFLTLGTDDIKKLVNYKIGPGLKVENLIGLLKARMNPAQARFLATIKKTP